MLCKSVYIASRSPLFLLLHSCVAGVTQVQGMTPHCCFSQALRDGSALYPVFPVEAARDELVATLKSIILSRLGLTEVEGEGFEWRRFLALYLPFFLFLPLSLPFSSLFALPLSLAHC